MAKTMLKVAVRVSDGAEFDATAYLIKKCSDPSSGFRLIEREMPGNSAPPGIPGPDPAQVRETDDNESSPEAGVGAPRKRGRPSKAQETAPEVPLVDDALDSMDRVALVELARTQYKLFLPEWMDDDEIRSRIRTQAESVRGE